MDRINFASMLLPANQAQANVSAMRGNQFALGDRFVSALKGVNEQLQADKQEEAKRKAQEIQARAQAEWNKPDGLFAGLDSDEKKARKVSALLAPWDALASDKWASQADLFADRMAKSAQGKEKLEYDLQQQNRELQSKEYLAELDAKAKAEAERAKAFNVDLKPDDYAQGMSAFNAGNYQQWWNARTAGGTNSATTALPSPTLDPKTIEKSLTLGKSGDPVQASSIESRTKAEQLKGDIAQQGFETGEIEQLSKRLGLSEDELKALIAKKEIKYETGGKGDAKFAPSVRAGIQKIRDSVYKVMRNYAEWKEAIQKVEAVLPESGNLSGFKAISAIVGFNKIIDPSSVVRETEFDNAKNATGKLDGYSMIFSRFVNGDVLSADGVQSLKQFIATQKPVLEFAINGVKTDAMNQASAIAGQRVTLDDLMGSGTAQTQAGAPAKVEPAKTQKGLPESEDGDLPQ